MFIRQGVLAESHACLKEPHSHEHPFVAQDIFTFTHSYSLDAMLDAEHQ